MGCTSDYEHAERLREYMAILEKMINACDKASSLELRSKRYVWLTSQEKFSLWKERMKARKAVKFAITELNEACERCCLTQIDHPKKFFKSMVFGPAARDKIDFFQHRIDKMKKKGLYSISPAKIETDFNSFYK